MKELKDIEAYFYSISGDLQSMNVDLDDDPLIYGPKRLQQKISECRLYLSKVMVHLIEVDRYLLAYKRRHNKAKLQYDMDFKHILATDVAMEGARSIKDREAIASNRLRSQQLEVDDLSNTVVYLDMLHRLIKARQDDLKDTQNRISQQQKLCQDEILLGSQWGSRLPPSARRRLEAPAPVDDVVFTDDVIQAALRDADDLPQVKPLPVVGGSVVTTPGLEVVEPTVVAEPTGDSMFDEILASFSDPSEESGIKPGHSPMDLEIDDLF